MPARLLPTCAVLILLLAPLPAGACNVPVFRYALEQWPANPYDIVVFHRGPAPGGDGEAIDQLRRACAGREGTVNATLTVVDLAQPAHGAGAKSRPASPPAVLPWMEVRYPDRGEGRPPAWSGPLNADSVRRLLDSPARAEIVRRLAAGESVVWLLVESGSKEQDEETARRLRGQLKELEHRLKLSERTGADGSVDEGPRLPLRLSFPLVRVVRDDPEETFFLDLLLNGGKEPIRSPDPVLFAVFGQGRFLEGVAGKAITAEAVRERAEFLCGDCSCLVKELNPGTDLLLAADWAELLDTGSPVSRREAVPSSRVTVPAARAEAPRETRAAGTGASPAAFGMRRLLLAAIGLCSVLAAVTLLWALRSPRRPTDAGQEPGARENSV